MIKVVILLFICGLAFAQRDHCDPDTAKLCANIKNGLKAINTGAQKVGRGIDVEEVKRTLDGPLQSTIIHGNFTLLLITLENKPNNYAARKCLKDSAYQSTQIANYLDRIAPKLQNDKDKVLDVQRNLRSVSKLYIELKNPTSTEIILLERIQICRKIYDNFDKIDSGATRISNGEDVNKVKAEVDGPQLASNIKNDYVRLSVVSKRIPKDEDFEKCMAEISARADQQVLQIDGILYKHADDRDKANAVFKDFNEIYELQIEHIRCPPKSQGLFFRNHNY